MQNVKDTDGNVIQRLLYDSDGRVVKEMDAGGYLSGADDSSRYGTLYSYNLAGWLVEKKVPLKKENGIVYYQITRYNYYKTGKLLTEKTSQEYVTVTGEPAAWNTISYSYDKNGNIKTVTDTDGGLVEYAYDAMGRLKQENSGRKGAFNKAKENNGIPRSEQPEETTPNYDKRGNAQPGRQYKFKNGTTIRDDSAGHEYQDDPSQNIGPHFNDPAGNHYIY